MTDQDVAYLKRCIQMKNLSLLCACFCLFLCPLFYGSCDEDKNELPPITMEGKNTFGCLANGKLWSSKGALVFQGGTYAELQISGDTTAINIYADNVNRNDGNIVNVVILTRCFVPMTRP